MLLKAEAEPIISVSKHGLQVDIPYSEAHVTDTVGVVLDQQP